LPNLRDYFQCLASVVLTTPFVFEYLPALSGNTHTAPAFPCLSITLQSLIYTPFSQMNPKAMECFESKILPKDTGIPKHKIFLPKGLKEGLW
jgi:hypothetical protein